LEEWLENIPANLGSEDPKICRASILEWSRIKQRYNWLGHRYGRIDECWQHLPQLDGNLEITKDFEQLSTWLSFGHI
jgi:hypothetical protein